MSDLKTFLFQCLGCVATFCWVNPAFSIPIAWFLVAKLASRTILFAKCEVIPIKCHNIKNKIKELMYLPRNEA